MLAQILASKLAQTKKTHQRVYENGRKNRYGNVPSNPERGLTVGRRLKLNARSDFIERLAEATPLVALEELIWNSFDENASQVHVILHQNSIDRVETIEVRDDGKSLPHSRATDAFENLGRSNKVNRTLDTGERLHGRKGEGRHKALSIGRTVVWHFTYELDGKRMSYDVTGTAGREDPFYLDDERPAKKGESVGCIVTVREPTKSLYSLTQPDSRSRITSQFAPFLLQHTDRHLTYDGRPIRPKDAISSSKHLRPIQLPYLGKKHAVKIQIIQWKEGQRKEILLCTDSGIPMHEVSNRSIAARGNFSVFASSKLFDHLHEQNQLSNIEMTDDRKAIVSAVRQRVRRYFRKLLQNEAEEAIQRLRDEGSYPYSLPPQSDLAKVEQRVFDLCAVQISRHLPSFSERMDVPGRTLLLRMIREAISQNPTSVGKIIREVCRLPEQDARSFAELIDDIPLSSVVHLGTMVAERLSFLTFFERIVHLNPFDERIKERTQLHRILAQNTWLFGEEYAIGTDDTNLISVLEMHIELLGRTHLQPELQDADIASLLSDFNRTREKTPESLARIPDLMLYRKFVERRLDEYEFLVIEIKRPGDAIGRKQIAQIEDYAKAVVTTPFTDMARTQWVFVLISDSLDEHAQMRANQQGMPASTIHKPINERYEIRVLSWAQIIRSANSRHEHLRDWLNKGATVDKVLERTETKYKEYLPPPKKKKVTAKQAKKGKKRSGRRRKGGQGPT